MSDLNGTWRLTWEAIDGAEGVPACDSPIEGRVPGDVHSDLINAGILPEPLVGTNVPKYEWVERAVFTYGREFRVDSDFDRAELVFNGLDCLAEIFVDSNLVGSSANAFVPHVFDVTPFVQDGKLHHLRVKVDTGVHWAKMQDRSQYLACDAEFMERIFLRKPQFSFKWDWAPRLVTCGIWRDVELKLYKYATIRDVMLSPTFEGGGARLQAKVEVEAFRAGDYVLKLRAVRGPGVWQSTQAAVLDAGTNCVEIDMLIDPVDRWYPVGYGDQALYTVEVEIEKAGEIVDAHSTIYGFKEVVIRQDPINENEKTFIINVNGIDVFCRGANWVPADSIVARVTDEKYEALVHEALAANFNMFRVWGGGIYEKKVFYDLCDRHGIMIWQDFMFACAEYPDDKDWFLDNVRDEAAKAIRMLRDHPSMTLWCGNNENDWAIAYWERGKGNGMVQFYGKHIYHEMLPEICSTLDPQRPYWPSSPFGIDDPNGEMVGDRHAWDVSIHDKELLNRADIRNYRKDRGKFISEYGMFSSALPRTILDYTQDGEIDFESEAFKVHDNSCNVNITGTESLIDWYLKLAFGGVPTDYMTYIWQSLAYQAMGYREAIMHFRTRKFECAGSLFWMYSDCWGTPGWTIIDYYLRRKPSFYWVKKAYAPIAVFVREENGVARTYVVNDTLSEVPMTLKLEVANLSGEGRDIEESLVVPANGVIRGPKLECGPGYTYAQIEIDGKVISDDLALTHFPSEIDIPPVNVSARIRQVGDELEVTVESDGFGHFVYLDLPDGAVPSDNYFNLLPKYPKVVRVTGAAADQIEVGTLNLLSRS